MLADLWTGQTGGAEVFFIIATVLAVIAAVAEFTRRAGIALPLIALAIAAVAFGWVLL